MELEKVDPEKGNRLKGYRVLSVTPTDIAAAGKDFLDLARGLGGLEYLNAFTLAEFNKQLRKRFSSRGPKETGARC